MASPVIAQNRPQANAATATSVSKTWAADTVAGDRLLAIVSFEANGFSNISITPADTTWKVKTPPGRITRQAAGVDELVVAVYEIINAPARLAANAEVFNLSHTAFATLELLRITGADLIQANELAPVTTVGSGLAITMASPGTAVEDCLAIFIATHGNPASTLTGPGGGYTLLDDIAPASTGSDRLRCDIYTKSVAAGVAVGGGTATISGATNRNFAGMIITIPAPVAPGPDTGVVQSELIFPAQGTAFDVAWPAPTVLGNRLYLIVGEDENNVVTLPSSVPAAWGSPVTPPGAVIRTASGLNVLSIRVYEILNAASRSGNEHIVFDHSIYPMLGLVELEGMSTSLGVDKEAHAAGGGLTSDTGATANTTITDGLSLGIALFANIETLSPQAVDSYTEVASGNSGGSGSAAKCSGGVYVKPISVAGPQELHVDISGGITRSWATLLLAIPAATQSSGGGSGSPFLPNLDDGRMHRGLSLHYGSPVTSLTLAQQTAAKFGIGMGTYDATGGQYNDFLDDILAIQPGFLAGFYGKSVQIQASPSDFPHAYYAYTAGGQNITTFNNSILVMQPDGAATFSDPRGFTSSTWRDWVGKDHKFLMDHENARSPVGNKIRAVYLDSMGTSSYKGTQVSPFDGHTYTSSQWIALVRTIGDAMRAAVDPSVMVWGNGLTSGPNYFHAATPTAGLLDHVDGGVCENWIRNNFASVTSFFTETQWQDAVNMMIDISVARAKAGWCVVNIANYAAGNAPTGWTAPSAADIDKWIRYSTCSWYLGQRGSCFYEFVSDSRQASQGTDHPYWNQRLGSPLEFAGSASAMKVGSAAYHRLFTAGLVLVNPQSSGNLTYTADRDYKDPVSGAAIATGATITLTPNTGLMLLTTDTTSGTPNQSAPTVTWDLPTPSLFADTNTKTVQVTIIDPDGVATPGSLFQDGVNKGAMTEVGSGTTTRVFQKTGVVFPDGIASTLSVTVADLHASPLTTVGTHQFEYQSTPPTPPPTPEPPPTTVVPAASLGDFSGYIYDDIAPLDFL